MFKIMVEWNEVSTEDWVRLQYLSVKTSSKINTSFVCGKLGPLVLEVGRWGTANAFVSCCFSKACMQLAVRAVGHSHPRVVHRKLLKTLWRLHTIIVAGSAAPTGGSRGTLRLERSYAQISAPKCALRTFSVLKRDGVSSVRLHSVCTKHQQDNCYPKWIVNICQCYIHATLFSVNCESVPQVN